MIFAFVLWTTAVLATPLAHLHARSPFESPAATDQPDESVIGTFVQNTIPPRSARRNLVTLDVRNPEDEPDDLIGPDSTVFYDVRDWQWDQTHDGHTDRKRVKAAWAMARELIESAKRQLKDLETSVDKFANSPYANQRPDGLPLSGSEVQLEIRKYIARYDPAYTQIFAADQHSIGFIHNNFAKVLDGVTKQDAEGRDNMEIYLTAIKSEAYPVDAPTEDLCLGKEGRLTQAFVIQAKSTLWWKKMVDTVGKEVSIPEDSWTINFCQGFFDTADMTAKLNELENGGNQQDVCNLANIDSTARVLVHEWTHFPFTLNTNEKKVGQSAELQDDWVGYDKAASRSFVSTGRKGDKKKLSQVTKVDAYSGKNADSYAWFAVYGYMNNLDGCAGVHWTDAALYTASDCRADVWPPGEKKFVKNNWQCWFPGDRSEAVPEYCRDGYTDESIESDEDKMDID
ncbi:hypothetical protein BDW02DRAFT_621462 [Decorospora gaudefroyi]|uniref:Lysine-specific metallo-endopeptidase domain-containing protein n=1 Tax=Decorospora gaudefroyi TaxID=184978 RepID=A0A6A5KFQ2_9PLEO|nr:hypothetical protein BDW02DRAFT_621462 [Decorospora gaudefroyi]